MDVEEKPRYERTSVSLPKEVHDYARQASKDMKIPLSHFFVRAIAVFKEYLEITADDKEVVANGD